MPRRILLFTALVWIAAASGAERTWIPGWQQTAALNIPRAGAVIVVAGDHVYAIGGIDGRRFLKSVEYAHILPDGTLSPWELTAPMTEERGFFAGAVHGGYLYVAGGGNGDSGKNLLRTVERAAIRGDGRLGSWERLDSELNYTRRCVKLAVVGDSLYALGGFGGMLLDSVEQADFRPDGGGLGPFRLVEHAFAIPRYIHAAQTTDKAVYVLGGHNDQEGTGRPEVEYAAIGSTLRWRPTAALLQPRYALSAGALGDYLYALGGLDGPVYIDSIEVSRIAGDGALGPWRQTTPLSSPRANLGTFEYGGRLYVIGGTNRDGYFRTVEFAERNAAGDLGYYGSAAEAASAQHRRAEQREQHRLSGPILPNEGVIEEIIQTDVYSYLRVRGPGGEQWIAAPRADYAVRHRIRYSGGTPMGDFYSRKLGRTFASILFVESTARVE